MFNSNLPESSELLKNVLEPLLDDFSYWFGRSRSLLENERIEFLTDAEQTDLLNRVQSAADSVRATQTMVKLMDNQAGVDTAVLLTWHHLVTECWKVAMRHRANRRIEE